MSEKLRSRVADALSPTLVREGERRRFAFIARCFRVELMYGCSVSRAARFYAYTRMMLTAPKQ